MTTIVTKFGRLCYNRPPMVRLNPDDVLQAENIQTHC